jgi:glutaminase
MASKKSNNALVAATETSNMEDHDSLQLFTSVNAGNDDKISLSRFWKMVAKSGILKDDPRLMSLHKQLNEFPQSDELDGELTFEQFKQLINQNSVVRNALKGNMIIPDFKSFCDSVEEVFYETKKNNNGKVASYIPQLARVNPHFFGVSVCTVDGQRFSVGDSDETFSIQSVSKPITYAIALEEMGEEKVHQHVGREPSGQKFNQITLNDLGRPHNPLINAGAIMSCSLIAYKRDNASVFDMVTNTWRRLAGGKKPGFNNSVYQSERETADRNFALAYFMRENQAFPEGTDLIKVLEFYFQCCSIEANTELLSIVASTLANAGVCPLSGERIFSPATVRNCLSLMSSCGMYDYSGEFAFTIGLPAKSGVSGALMVVIPRVMGIAIWSPPLDPLGNSVRGIEFCKRLVARYNFHTFDVISSESSEKINPTLTKYQGKAANVLSLVWAATYGDIDEIQRLEANGVDLNVPDYDGRTAMHLACAEGQLATVKYLVSKGAKLNVVDRWGTTPYEEAVKNKKKHVADFLKGLIELQN